MSSDILGGFVYCFAVAQNLRSALDLMEVALAEDKYQVLEAEYIGLYDEAGWEDDETTERHDALMRQARKDEDVVYSEFYTYANR